MSHEQSTIIKDEELILRALAAATASVDGTGLAIGPTGLVKAVVRTTVLTSGASLAIAIQESDTLGSGYATIASFPAITAIGIVELPFRATKRYVRYSCVAADAKSVTYEILATTAEK
jgi:hypothetical protein